MRNLMLLGVVLLGAVGCRHGDAPPKVRDFEPTGVVMFQKANASFDGARIVGPFVNMNRRDDGSWTGLLGGQPVEAAASGAGLRGVNLTLNVESSAAGTVVTGQWQGRAWRFELRPQDVVVKAPAATLNLAKKDEGTYGPEGELRLTGDAAKADAPQPQLALALLGTFLGAEAQGTLH